jgi:hypothetical protein
MAKVMVGGIKTGRRVNERVGDFLRNFIPKLLPGTDSTKPLVVPTYAMVFMAIIIPADGLGDFVGGLQQLRIERNVRGTVSTGAGRERTGFRRNGTGPSARCL